MKMVSWECIIIRPMITANIPGFGPLEISHLVSDVNGTLAVDGMLLPGVAEALQQLTSQVQIHLITADTHGRQAEIDAALGLRAVRLQPGGEAEQKAAYVHNLGADSVAAVGQGANDALMLRAARVGIGVLSPEGLAQAALTAADVIVPDILSALMLLQNPKRLTATLRK